MADIDKSVLLALAEVATPAGQFLPTPSEALLGEVHEVVRDLYGPSGGSIYGALVRAIEMAAIPLSGYRLSQLPLAKRRKVMHRLDQSAAMHWPLRAAVAPLKAAQARNPCFLRSIGATGPTLPVAIERNRWDTQIIDVRTLPEDEELEVDVVIVGTGAGGAPMANALAARGHAVLMIEEGGNHTRSTFDGNALKAQRRMFRQGGLTVALGNTVIPLPTGQTVGGSTTINSGTCYRIPDSVHRRWVLEDGLTDLGPGSLDAHYESVEHMLQVTCASPETLGGCARVIARGADALGLAHGPLMRNAPACDGQGVCCFGCPTGAKRSTNVSYVPAALKQGAMVYCNAHVTDILTHRGRAVGVSAVAGLEGGARRHVKVRAHAVVLAGGSIGTPAMLLKSGLANRSGQVGRQLSIHPACYSWAQFDEDIRGWAGIPQGYAIEEYADQGLRFEGAFMPPDMAAASMAQIGESWTTLVERLHNLACFGFMVADSSRGRVHLGRNGQPQVRYSINDRDLLQMIRGHAILARVYLAAGAEMVYPALSEPWSAMQSEADIVRFEREAPSRLKARHVNVSAFHPLGSCRMHGDPLRGVTGSTGETHQVPNLFVCDGSAVPGPLGVNPQMTIMALSERSALFVERRIEEGSKREHTRSASAPREQVEVSASPAARLGFAETMSGRMVRSDGVEVDAEFEVRASVSLNDASDQTAIFALEGVMHLPGIADAAPCDGTLTVRPLERKGTLCYRLRFDADDGRPCELRGEKHVSPLKAWGGMTTLHTAVTSGGHELARGILKFNVRDIPSWLSTFQLGKH